MNRLAEPACDYGGHPQALRPYFAPLKGCYLGTSAGYADPLQRLTIQTLRFKPLLKVNKRAGRVPRATHLINSSQSAEIWAKFWRFFG